MGSKREKLKYMSIVFKAFSVATYVMQWYEESARDEVISKEEVSELGLGICDLLGVNTDIDLSKP
jgi:hypothetical protein